MYKINTYFTTLYLRYHNVCNDTTSQQRCVNVVYETTLRQLRCNAVVTLAGYNIGYKSNEHTTLSCD